MYINHVYVGHVYLVIYLNTHPALAAAKANAFALALSDTHPLRFQLLRTMVCIALSTKEDLNLNFFALTMVEICQDLMKHQWCSIFSL